MKFIVLKDLSKLFDNIPDLIELHYQSELAEIKYSSAKGLFRDPIKLTVKEVKSKIKYEIKQNYVYFLCYDKNRIIGLIKYLPDYGCYGASFIQEVIVHSDYRGLRIGDKLMSRVIKFNKNKKIILRMNSNNIPALHLYEKYGFNQFCKLMVR